MSENLWSYYKTDPKLEVDGVEHVSSIGVTFQLARAGGANSEYEKLLQRRLKPYQTASGEIREGALSDEEGDKILAGVYADTIVKGFWDTAAFKASGEKNAPTGPDGQPFEFTRANVVRLLTELPELFKELRAVVRQWQLYRTSTLEGDAQD